MNELSKLVPLLPREQEAIRAKIREERIERSIPERFERIERLFSARLALKMGDCSLTYEELNQAANRIGRAILTSRGQGSEPVALLFEHGIDVIAAIFGVLKAGKFYVALDPSFPAERTQYILKDTQARLILTNSRNLHSARHLASDSEILNTDAIGDSISSSNLETTLSPDSLANIRYTSGSTGEPKGIVQGHLQVLQFASLGAIDRGIKPDDRLTLLHYPGFGAANTHLFQSLLNGAALFPFDIKTMGIERLTEYLSEEKITVCSLSPSLFRQLAPAFPPLDRLLSLRLITLVGAPVVQVDFELYKKHFADGTLLEIALGSTEAGAICSAFIDQQFLFPKEGSPVGYPCRGKRILLLGENGRAVEPGQPGEIAVTGSSLNLGYWRRPELTSAKYVSSPVEANDRLCLTGDLGMMRSDGFLIYLGRKDSQIKIRGYRVETEETEKAFLMHPAVRDAGVVGRPGEPGETYLAAYVVPRGNGDVTVGDLRSFLASKLPDYMIPFVFVFLDSLPLVNGKLDRNALPDPKEKPRPLSTPYVPPRNEVERRLLQIWEEALHIRPLGIHDNFFDLGGHSLLAVRIISKIIDVFGVDVSIRNLLDAPTVAGLAEIIEALQRTNQDVDALFPDNRSEEDTGEL